MSAPLQVAAEWDDIRQQSWANPRRTGAGGHHGGRNRGPAHLNGVVSYFTETIKRTTIIYDTSGIHYNRTQVEHDDVQVDGDLQLLDR